MGWWQELVAFVSGGFGGLIAWEKAHSIVGTLAAGVSIAIAVRQLSKRRAAQHELEAKSIRLAVVEKELEVKSAQLYKADKEIKGKQKKLDEIERASHSDEKNLWDFIFKRNTRLVSAEGDLLSRRGL